MTGDFPIPRSICTTLRDHRRNAFVLLVCGSCFAATLGVATPSAAQETIAQAAKSTQQMWFGTMEIKDVRQFRFVLQLAKNDAAWSGVLKSLDEGGQEFEMSGIVSTESSLKFELPKTAAVYEGTWDKDGELMKGKWKQRGQELDLAFRQVKERPRRKIEAAWKGTIDALIQKLDVAFVELESGQIVFDSISQKVGGFFVKDESTEGEVVYRVPAVGGVFKGKYSDDKSQIDGKWSQGLARFEH